MNDSTRAKTIELIRRLQSGEAGAEELASLEQATGNSNVWEIFAWLEIEGLAPDKLLDLLLGSPGNSSKAQTGRFFDPSPAKPQTLPPAPDYRERCHLGGGPVAPETLPPVPDRNHWHIRAFGACMIEGFPHRYEDSFFHHALEQLRHESSHDVTSSIFTLGGFPVTRAQKHLQSKCLSANPDLVVIQFAATDLVVPLRRKKNRDGTISSLPHAKSTKPATALHVIKWKFQGLVGDILRLSPVTPVDTYLESMIELVRTLRQNQVIPVIMSPFVFGGSRSHRIARQCARRLQAAVANVPGAFYMDTFSALDRHPRSSMLLADGVHLSLAGQKIVAGVLSSSLKAILDGQATLAEKNSFAEHQNFQPDFQMTRNASPQRQAPAVA
jgi:lysophospholipase L1-like esterase